MKTGLLIFLVFCGLTAPDKNARSEELPDVVGPCNMGVRIPLLASSTFLTGVNAIDLGTGHNSRLLGSLGILSGFGTLWAEAAANDPESWVMGVVVATFFVGVLNFIEVTPQNNGGSTMLSQVAPLISIDHGSHVYVGVSARIRF
jgi:hypothetical protein